MMIEALLQQLQGVRLRGTGRWSALCPAHDDKSPSLSIKEGADGRILLHDFGGCTPREIVAALGLELKDLFSEATPPKGQRPAPQPPKLDRVALAFRFDLHALDLHLRAERIIEAGKALTVALMTDEELDHALDHVAQAHRDCERADDLEHVADNLKMKAFIERDHEQQRRIA